MDTNKIRETLRSLPEVSKEEAFMAVMHICSLIDEGDPKGVACLSQIAGYAAASDDPELTRRWIVYQQKNGPISL